MNDSQKPIRKPVPGYPFYQIDAEGQLFTNHGGLDVWDRVAGNRDKGMGKNSTLGRRSYTLRGIRGRPLTTPAARLVLLAFVGPPTANAPHACHRDGDATNDRLDNLYWGSARENMQDRANHGRGRGKLTDAEVMYIRSCGKSLRELAYEFDMTEHGIRCIRQGKSYKHLLPGQTRIIEGRDACGA